MCKKNKVVLIGTGFVGMSMAYSFLTTGGIDELVLIDIDEQKAIGEAMDLSHGLPYAKQPMTIKAGTYDECKNADMAIITAGVIQTPEETRLDLTARNTMIVKSVTQRIMESGFNGIIIVTSNPVDAMTYVVQKVSGLSKERVIGSGTILDTARLRYLLSEYLEISSNNMHAYIMGEHGDSSFVPWDITYVGSKRVLDYVEEKGLSRKCLYDIYMQVQQAGYDIVKRKKATYYGIGLSLNRLVQAVLNDENIILTVSAYQNSEYGVEDIYIGVPAIINRNGIREIIRIDLNGEDSLKFKESCKVVRELNEILIKPLL